MNIQILFYIVLSIITAVLSVVLFKIGYNNVGSFQFSVSYIIRWLLEPFVLCSMIAAFLHRVVFYFLFNSFSATEVFLITMIQIPAVVVACYFVFGEALTYKQILGAALIIGGVSLVGIK
jgi:uncharacterized membrane protein